MTKLVSLFETGNCQAWVIALEHQACGEWHKTKLASDLICIDIHSTQFEHPQTVSQ